MSSARVLSARSQRPLAGTAGRCGMSERRRPKRRCPAAIRRLWPIGRACLGIVFDMFEDGSAPAAPGQGRPTGCQTGCRLPTIGRREGPSIDATPAMMSKRFVRSPNRGRAAACLEASVSGHAPPAISSTLDHGRADLIIVVQEAPGRQSGVGPGLPQTRRPIIASHGDLSKPCSRPLDGRGE